MAEKEDALKSLVRKYTMIYSTENNLISAESKLSFNLFAHVTTQTSGLAAVLSPCAHLSVSTIKF